MMRMKGTVRKKLGSNRGASLIAALLFFLVCAAIGSVILAAGTASVGRLSSLAKEEQRYASVTSAAELLRAQIQNSKVCITQQKAQTVTSTFLVTQQAGDTTGVAMSTGYSKVPEGEFENLTPTSQYSWGTAATKAQDLTTENTDDPAYFLKVAVESNYQSPTAGTREIAFTLTPENSAYPVEGKLKMDAMGNITVTLQNSNEDDAKQYQVKISCTASVTASSDKTVDDPEPVKSDESTNAETGVTTYTKTQTVTTTEVKTTEIQWPNASIEKVQAG